MGGSSADWAYLTPGQAARILGVSTKTINRWANAGRIPCSLTVGGHRRFRPDVIAAVGSLMSLKDGN
ncbi:MAG TPA: helix-turn-helix domain-containing protein [Acidimicrobiales bacterium]|jgi:excisionase family DNA binding protein|nr:helix-turn-helix domain-containing protein [Acidimicrobiales bacterium]